MNLRQGISSALTTGYHLIGLERPRVFKSHDLFFEQGWGDSALLGELSDSGFLHQTLKGERVKIDGSEWIEFNSPLKSYLKEGLKKVNCRFLRPPGHSKNDPVLLLFAMTGDEGFERRQKSFSEVLMKKNIATLLVENPYYGLRKDPDQKSYFLSTVQDMLLMSSAVVQEGRLLVESLAEQGYKEIGVGGLSQGGMVAAVIAALSEVPVSVGISLAAHSPDVIFTQGLLRSFVDWKALGLRSAKQGSSIFQRLFRNGDVTLLDLPKKTAHLSIQLAKRDFVVPKESVLKIHQHWKSSKLHWLRGTHLSSLGLHSSDYNLMIQDIFPRP